jgi:hypothetical protein
MQSIDPSLALAFAAVIGGMVAYLAAFVLLNATRQRPPRDPDEVARNSPRDEVAEPPSRPPRRNRHELTHPPLTESTPY